jgi:hypothetical protein
LRMRCVFADIGHGLRFLSFDVRRAAPSCMTN